LIVFYPSFFIEKNTQIAAYKEFTAFNAIITELDFLKTTLLTVSNNSKKSKHD
tara:strand:+ start:139 stop:297 length:159 start_codon:yes stop_codon:yes gene_type:complete